MVGAKRQGATTHPSTRAHPPQADARSRETPPSTSIPGKCRCTTAASRAHNSGGPARRRATVSNHDFAGGVMAHPCLNLLPTSGSPTYTTSPSALAAKVVMPTVATFASTLTHSWSLE
jgi:hypothetical protein